MAGCWSDSAPPHQAQAQTDSSVALQPSSALQVSSSATEVSPGTDQPIPTSQIAASENQPPDSVSIVLPTTPNPTTQRIIDLYLDRLAARGFNREGQGVWIQMDQEWVAAAQGSVPLPAASVTKVATTLAVFDALGPDYRFLTSWTATGPIQNGILTGDLVVQGSGDPFFVWEDAIAVANLLQQAGIQQVSGNLIVTGRFAMNFQTDPQVAGEILRQGLNAALWPPEAETQYQTLSPGTPRPQITIQGSVQVVPNLPDQVPPLLQHASLPVAELLKKMNLYSNNVMANQLADQVGGAAAVAEKVSNITGIPLQEIQLVNGSGLGIENRISPRAACAMLLAIDQLLERSNLSLTDVMAIVGQDQGVLQSRSLPPVVIAKSGTLNAVSSLAGVLPTQQGTLWFVIMNTSADLQGSRLEQDAVLRDLLQQWGSVSVLPANLRPTVERANLTSWSKLL